MSAHLVIHLAAGMILGALISSRALFRAWKQRGPYAAAVRRWMFMTYAGGLFAAIPSLLRRLGTPDMICDGWWMNIFVAYPAINTVVHGGLLIGEGLLSMLLMAQYLVMMTILWQLKQRPTVPSQSL